MKLFPTTKDNPSAGSDTSGSCSFTTTSEAENENLFSFLPSAVGAKSTIAKKAVDFTTTKESGFTLIEMLTAIGVIAMILSITLTQQSNFSETVNLNNVAHEIALTIRQAQSYGLTSLDKELVGEDIKDSAYGVDFDANSPQTFMLYRDTKGHKGHQKGEEVEVYQLPGEMEIIRVCINNTEGDASCTSGEGDEDGVAITFSRPNPDAAFRDPKNGKLHSNARTVVIVVEDDSGSQESVVVRSIGFISVQ